MDIGKTLREARLGAGYTLRQLGLLAQTSHSAIAAYESGSKVPRADTLVRILAATGWSLDVRPTSPSAPNERLERGDELVEVLRLAEMFPARHSSEIDARFGMVA